MNDNKHKFHTLTPVLGPQVPVTGSLKSVRLSSDVRERLIVECFTNKAIPI